MAERIFLNRENQNDNIFGSVEMVDTKDFFGGREIASDVLFGMYSIAEIADASDIPYTMSASFEETIDAEIVE